MASEKIDPSKAIQRLSKEAKKMSKLMSVKDSARQDNVKGVASAGPKGSNMLVWEVVVKGPVT